MLWVVVGGQLTSRPFDTKSVDHMTVIRCTTTKSERINELGCRRRQKLRVMSRYSGTKAILLSQVVLFLTYYTFSVAHARARTFKMAILPPSGLIYHIIFQGPPSLPRAFECYTYWSSQQGLCTRDAAIISLLKVSILITYSSWWQIPISHSTLLGM